jgi:ribosomal-protein-alanine N-acetyltransferase
MPITLRSKPIPHPFSKEAPALLGLNALKACVALDQRAMGGFWSAKQWQEELQREEILCYGSWNPEKADQLLGLSCGWVVAEELQISMVLVDPAVRQQGLGTMLLKELLRKAEALGCLMASLEVSENNIAAIALYENSGFTTSRIRGNYYQNGDNALVKVKNLCKLDLVRITGQIS